MVESQDKQDNSHEEPNDSTEPYVYIPMDTIVNFDLTPLDIPTVEYEKRKRITNIEIIAKIAGGQYDSNMRSRNRYGNGN